MNWAVFTPGQTTGRRANSVEIPTSGQMVFGAYIPTTYVNQYGQPQQTIGAHWATTPDCTLTQVASITRDGQPYYLGLTTLNTYVGVIDLADTSIMDYVNMYGGTIKQDNSNTLTVGASLDWTDGTINPLSSPPAYLNLAPSATGLIHPNDGNDGTVDLGDTLELLGTPSPNPGVGSTLSIIGGTVVVLHGQIIADEFSSLNLIAVLNHADDPVASLKIDGKDNTEVRVKVKPKSKAVATTTRD